MVASDAINGAFRFPQSILCEFAPVMLIRNFKRNGFGG